RHRRNLQSIRSGAVSRSIGLRYDAPDQHQLGLRSSLWPPPEMGKWMESRSGRDSWRMELVGTREVDQRIAVWSAERVGISNQLGAERLRKSRWTKTKDRHFHR